MAELVSAEEVDVAEIKDLDGYDLIAWETFVAAALEGLAHATSGDWTPEVYANTVCAVADAMMVEREKRRAPREGSGK